MQKLLQIRADSFRKEMTKNLQRQNDIDTLISAMFDEPFRYRNYVEKIISRNSKLSSKIRRELTTFAYDAFKWRNRLWNEKPETSDYDAIQSQIKIFQDESLQDVIQKVSKMNSIEEQSLYLSFPAWILQKWIDGYGLEKAIEIAWTQNHASELCIRANGPKENFEKVKKSLQDEGIEVRDGEVAGAMYVQKKTNVRGLHAFKKGLFEVQDEHSQQVCLWTNPRQKDFIIDGCARTGGKALHLAALQNNEGRIICMDVDARVFEELENRSKRLGIKTIENRWIAKDDPAPCADLKEKADIVFVDAPCSGTGTIRHNPSIKWSLESEKILEFQNTQVEILRRQSRWVKKRGILVFVTCSNFKEENEDVINLFLKDHLDFKSVEQQKLLPKENGGDGFFFAKLRRDS